LQTEIPRAKNDAFNPGIAAPSQYHTRAQDRILTTSFQFIQRPLNPFFRLPAGAIN
jgi:hypothetical protein